MIVLIEAGNLEYSPKLQETFSGVNNGNFDFDLRNSRIKQFGGSANIWGKRCRPLDPVDYKNWSNNEINLLKYQQEASEIFMLRMNLMKIFLTLVYLKSNLIILKLIFQIIILTNCQNQIL